MRKETNSKRFLKTYSHKQNPSRIDSTNYSTIKEELIPSP
eukprot:SAG11_NODE_24172_length_377_cov_0.733813_1_plen_39_part_10